MGLLIQTAELRERLGESGLRVVDCRFVLGEPGAGKRLWREAHIPGASFVDLDRDMAAPPSERGRHPLPEAADFEAAARRAGIGRRSRVVAYDEAGEGGAARLWWLLRHWGHEDAAVLDGGLRAWRAAGGPLTHGGEPVTAGDFEAGPPQDGEIASLDDVSAGAGILLDARAPERFQGEVEPVDAIPGHIPGARSLPFAELQPDGRFHGRDELRARFAAAGAEPGADAVAYCGSGVTACTLVLAAELAGIEGVRLYPGSYSEWTRRGRPVETGA